MFGDGGIIHLPIFISVYMNIKVIIIFACVWPCLVFAKHEKIETVRVRGEYALVLSSSNVTGLQAKELARKDAERQAVEKVCGSRVSIWDQVEVSRAGETFNSLSVNQVDGEIVEFEILKEGIEQSTVRSVETIFYCEAKVKVKRGVEPDPDFTANILGIKKVYYENEQLEFTFTPYRDGFLKIFLFPNATTGYRIYPNILESPVLLIHGKKYRFPTNDIAEYTITKDTDAPIEVNRLVFVFTKEERPFYQETTSRAEIERWIALIPNDKKYLYSVAFDIRRKEKVSANHYFQNGSIIALLEGTHFTRELFYLR